VNIESANPKTLLLLIKAVSNLTAAEMPAIGLAALAVVPGIFSAAPVAIGAGGLYLVVKLLRNYLEKHRDEILQRLVRAELAGELSPEEMLNARNLLNSMTVSGGANSKSG